MQSTVPSQFRIVRWAVGVILIAAACLKMHGLLTDAVVPHSWIMSVVAAQPAPSKVPGDRDAAEVMRLAPLAWQELLAQSFRFQGTISAKTTVDGQPQSHTEFRLRQNESCRLLINQRKASSDRGSDLRGEVKAYNQRYGFTLQRIVEDSDWFITSQVARQGTDAFSPFSADLDMRCQYLALRLIRVRGRDLSELFQQPTFRIVEARDISDNGASAVLIRFDNTHPWDAKPVCSIQRGTLVLDPQSFWCLRRAELEEIYSSGPSRCRIQFQYDRSSSGVPILVSHVDEGEGENVETKARQIYRVEELAQLEYATDLPPDEDFTLSAFGFAEPTTASWGMRWYILLAVIGVAFVALGIWLRTRRRTGT
jgi:hypothetical protein